MKFPSDLRYTKDHEWVRPEGDEAVVGITDYAQDALGDIVFIELPQKGVELAAEDVIGSVESVKAVSDIYSPVSGTVIAVNAALESEPSIVNKDPYGAGWIAKIRMSDPSECTKMMNAEQYEAFVEEES